MILMLEKEKPATLMMEGEGCDREVLQRPTDSTTRERGPVDEPRDGENGEPGCMEWEWRTQNGEW